MAKGSRVFVVMSMPRCATFTHDDPIPYQDAIRGGEIELTVTAKGGFRGKLIRIDLHELWMQHGSENLPRVIHCLMSKQRAGFVFNADRGASVAHYSGLKLDPNAIFVLGPGSSAHSRTVGPHSWASMSLATEDLSAASRALVGGELTNRPAVRLLHADPAHMDRLMRLHMAARGFAEVAPETLAHPEISVALENELVHALVSCLADEVPAKAGSGWRYHTAIIDRFEQVLAANYDRPIHLADICSAVGASERTLRASCEEHLGMGPIRYLWLRRMHLARRALLGADPATATVTQIATDYGFWELGRFSVSYQALFGEAPSASLRKAASSRKGVRARPFSFADSDFAQSARSPLLILTLSTMESISGAPDGASGFFDGSRPMTATGTAVFTNPDDYRIRIEDANLDLVLTGRGDFKARLTWVKLPHLHLFRGRENIERIAYVQLAPVRTFISFSLTSPSSSVWNGVELQPGDIVLHSRGERAHQWTKGTVQWALMSIPPSQLALYCKVLAEVDLNDCPVGRILRPPPSAAMQLRRLHSKACRLAEKRPEIFIHREAVRAAEQELIHALVECLAADGTFNHQVILERHAHIMTRFENALRMDSGRQPSMTELCATIGVPERTLRDCCVKFLGVSPGKYMRLRRLNLVRAELRRADPATSSVAQIARRYCFSELGRFAAVYRGIFGESPSVTLRNT